MIDVKVTIASKDACVGVMARALGDKVGGHQAVSGATDSNLEIFGFFTFHFQSEHSAHEFRDAINEYLGIHGAVAE
jgi:hypothetical protein